MTKRYFAATDGKITVFRGTDIWELSAMAEAA